MKRRRYNETWKEKGGTQSFVVMDENGEIGEVVIEEIAGVSRVSNGTYKVSYDFTGYWIAGFYIKVENNKITSAYSPFYSVALGSITNGVLTKNSITKATYAFIYKQLLISHATGVVASINDSELVVTKK